MLDFVIQRQCREDSSELSAAEYGARNPCGKKRDLKRSTEDKNQSATNQPHWKRGEMSEGYIQFACCGIRAIVLIW